jgi:type II secretory ATPase GspE/PulE/Tfp pilus assembly ATPase PilB-like protein
MPQLLVDQFERLRNVEPSADDYIPDTVEAVLRSAREAGATDIHLTPNADSLNMQWRIDGVLHAVTQFEAKDAPRVVARIKVLAGLLTYRNDVPQEGRISGVHETRVSTLPTLFGEKAVVRLFAEAGQYQWLEQLGLPQHIEDPLRPLLEQTGGVVLFTGPAGSGKTTTIYSCMREIAANTNGTRSLVSIEDPIEVVVPGVAQTQVNSAAGMDLAATLRAMMRQDPEVIMVGEIRDAETAEAVFQAALTGHLVLTTFHAGNATGAIGRLLDMGIEPYLLRSAIRAVVSQRLLRGLCADCSAKGTDGAHDPVGCDVCHGTGYRGRIAVGEMLCPDNTEAGRAILSRTDTAELQSVAMQNGLVPQEQLAREAVASGKTSLAEVYRVFGRQGLNSDA